MAGTRIPKSIFAGPALLGVTALVLILAPSPATAVEDPTESEPGYPEALDIEDHTVYPEFEDAPEGAPTARLTVVFDPISLETAKHVVKGEPFEFFIVAHDVQVALRAWEAQVVVDPRIWIVEREFDGMNVGTGNEIVTALKPKNCKHGTPVTLARFSAIVNEDDATDLVLGLAPIGKSSFDPPTPGYLVCRPGSDLRAFDACDTCAVLNPLELEPPSGARPPALDPILKPVRGR